MIAVASVALIGIGAVQLFPTGQPTGPYQLVDRQVGEAFFDAYRFWDGPDSLGSAGHNVYVGKPKADELGLFAIDAEGDVIMKSTPTPDGPRSSIRLEGRQRYDRGLFILDVAHLPNGCGVWPAWWMTDEAHWPDHGEIDIVEGINTQTVAKTALHTRESCSMFAHVPDWEHTGVWDRSTGLPDTYTGFPDFETSVPADDCWAMAPHRWANQGCVMMSQEEGTIGEGFNQNGGGVYILEWDPANRYIRSWVFGTELPANLQEALSTAALPKHQQVAPDSDTWGTPYAYFAIGETTGCSADHFQNMRMVFNLAFCGTVAGNRFTKDCPALSEEFNVEGDPILSCNAYIESNPDALDEAYWKIRGVYVYERTMQ